jgi:UDP-glucuronate 4-epimerase
VIEQFPPQPGDVRQTFADITLARRDLGFDPKTGFFEGIRKYVEWVMVTSL